MPDSTTYLHLRDWRMKMKNSMVIKLECGCIAKRGNRPLDNQKFCCPGAGHGYQLSWLYYQITPDGRQYYNNRTPE